MTRNYGRGVIEDLSAVSIFHPGPAPLTTLSYITGTACWAEIFPREIFDFHHSTTGPWPESGCGCHTRQYVRNPLFQIFFQLKKHSPSIKTSPMSRILILIFLPLNFLANSWGSAFKWCMGITRDGLIFRVASTASSIFMV